MEENKSKDCKDCKDTGIAIVTLDDTKDVGIQRCDTCKVITDKESITKVKETIYGSRMFFTIYRTTWTNEYVVQNSAGKQVFASMDLAECAKWIYENDSKHTKEHLYGRK